MGDFPALLASGGPVETIGAATAVSRGTTVTAAGTANTKGTATQLVAATARDASWIWVNFDDIAAGVDYLVDILIGASTEAVLIPNLYVGGGTGSISYGTNYLFPLHVPGGSRISARCQASTLSSAVRVSCLLFSSGFDGFEGYGKVTAYGANTADSGGVSVDPGGTANTKGAVAQIVAATSDPIEWMQVSFGNQLNTVRSSQSWLVDIMVGAATEQVLLGNIALNASTSPDVITPQSTPCFPISVAAGERLSAKAQSDGIDATDRLFDVIVYGVS
jgi:hypothetical protein